MRGTVEWLDVKAASYSDAADGQGPRTKRLALMPTGCMLYPVANHDVPDCSQAGPDGQLRRLGT